MLGSAPMDCSVVVSREVSVKKHTQNNHCLYFFEFRKWPRISQTCLRWGSDCFISLRSRIFPHFQNRGAVLVWSGDGGLSVRHCSYMLLWHFRYGLMHYVVYIFVRLCSLIAPTPEGLARLSQRGRGCSLRRRHKTTRTEVAWVNNNVTWLIANGIY